MEGREPSKKVPKKEELDRAVEIIKEVFCQLPCYDKIIPHLLSKPIEDLPKHCYLAPGIPIKPMLAHPTKGISEVLDRFANQNFTCEYKYDGEFAVNDAVCTWKFRGGQLPHAQCVLLPRWYKCRVQVSEVSIGA